MADIREHWAGHFKRQNCVSTKIAKYLDIYIPLWSNLVNSVLYKCVTLMVENAAATNYTFGGNNWKYYSRSIINQWTANYHYPSIDFESSIENILDQYNIWNRRVVGGAPPPDWNVFTTLTWTQALSFMKSLGQGYIKIKDIPNNSPGIEGLSVFQFDNSYYFLNIRDFTHKYLCILRGPTKDLTATFEQGTNNQKKRKGIGYISSRMNTINNNISGWIHSGPVCKEQEQSWMINNNRMSPFTNYIYRSIPDNSPRKHISYNVPIQCSISGSTNMILATLLWGTQSIVLSIEDFYKIIIGIIALLSLDGGHTMQEVLTATCLISNFYKFFITRHVNRANITCFNNDTINNLYLCLRNLEFLPQQIIIDEIGVAEYTDYNISLVVNHFSMYDLHNPRAGDHVYPPEGNYKFFVCYVMNVNRAETLAIGDRYFSFWTNTFEYIDISLTQILVNSREYDYMRLMEDNPDGTFRYEDECNTSINNRMMSGGGIASSKNKKNKKLRLLRSPKRSKGSGSQLSFGSPRTRKYRQKSFGSPTAPLKRSGFSPPLKRSPNSTRSRKSPTAPLKRSPRSRK